MEQKTKTWLALMALIFFSVTVGAQLDHTSYDSFTFSDFGAKVIDLFIGWGADILESWWILLFALVAFILVVGLVLIALYATGVGG